MEIQTNGRARLGRTRPIENQKRSHGGRAATKTQNQKMKTKQTLVQICRLVAWVCLISFRSSAETGSLPNFDRRLETTKTSQPAVANAAREKAASLIRARVQEVRIDSDELLGSPKFIASTRAFLTGANGSGGAVSAATAAAFPTDEPQRGVKTFLTEHSALFGFGPEALAAAKVKRDYVSASGGFSTTVWQQHVDDIAVFEAVFKAHLTQQGELINVSSQFVPDLPTASGRIAARTTLEAMPPISAQQAIILAAQNIGDMLATNQLAAQDLPQGNERVQHFRGSPVLNNTSARLAWLPVDAGTLRLCWNVNVESRARGELYQILVDAQTGQIWLRECLTDELSDATFNVWTNESPTPMMPTLGAMTSFQPPQVPRALVTFAALDTNASPAGWINDGDNTTVGNNVDAHLDWNNDNIADPGSHPAGSPNRVFSYAADLTQEPSNNWAPAVVSLFYWNNFAHDRYYEYGFTEAAGNFQSNNFGRGGTGNDPVQADGQDSYMLPATNGTSRDNANFSTPTDGSSPRMQMYIFNFPSPNRDDDLDATMMLHEYTHGVSSRLVGGGVGISALQTSEMGEGWSDFCALSLLSNPTNDPDANYGMFAYVGYNFYGMTSNYYFGLRRYPYSVSTNVNPLTYKDIDTNQLSAHTGVPISPWLGYNPANANEVHNAGEVWCIALWEARSRMCHKYGNAAGNQMMLQLVIDGMKLSPANPLFLQARDAILQADRADNGGANQDLLWAAFAKRGMGYSASSPGNNTTTGVGEAFNTPLDTNAPIIAVLSPANNATLNLLTNISGTAYDGGSGLQGNQIHFTLNNNGNFWSGSYWTNTVSTDPSILLTANVANGAWTFNGVPTGGNQAQGTYYISAYARDNAGNVSQAQSGVTSTSFVLSTTPPNVAITFPVNGSTITNQLSGNWFQGTASGNLGIPVSVSLFIRRNSDNLYWTGSGWGNVTNGFISNTYNSGTHAWQSTGLLPVPGSSLGNGTYHFIAIAADAAGVQQQVDSVVSVDFHPVYTFTAGSYFDADPNNDNMNWDNPANWDQASVPTSDARVVINGYTPDNTSLGSLQLYRLDLSGGTLTTAGMIITNLNISGGALSGGAISLPVGGVFNWSGGIIAGSYNVPAGAMVNLTGSADKTMSVVTLVNNGTVLWNGGNLVGSYGSVVTNNASFVIQSSGNFDNNGSGAGYYGLPEFVNNGWFQKTNSNGETIIAPDNGGWTFIQNGTIDIENGALSSQSQFQVNGGAVFAGPGETRVDAGSIVLSGTNTIQPGATVELAGGTWGGNNLFIGPGTFVWSGGTIDGINAVGAGANLAILGDGPKTLNVGTLTNAGYGVWTGAGPVVCTYGSTFENDGTFMVQNDSSFANNGGGAGYYGLPQFINTGSFVKTNSTGTNTTLFAPDNGGVAFNNYGTVTVQSGVLALGGGGSDANATFTIAAGSRLDLTGGVHNFGPGLMSLNGTGLTRLITTGSLTLNGNVMFNNGGTFEIDTNGNVTGNGTFGGTGIFNWTGGTISAVIGLQTNITLNVSGDGAKTLNVGTVTNAGHGFWTGAGSVNCTYGSTFENDGTFTVQNNSAFSNNGGGAGYYGLPVFINNGNLVKINSSGTTLFDSVNGGVAFNNNGIVNVQSGNVALAGGGIGSNGSLAEVAGSEVDFLAGNFSLAGNPIFSGAGSTRVNGGTVAFANSQNTLTAGATFEIDTNGNVTGNGTFGGTGTFNWTGGTISAVIALQTNIALNITGSDPKIFNVGSLANAGHGLWTGAGLVICTYGSTFENDGTFIIQTDSSFSNNGGGAGYYGLPAFINNGTLRKNITTGTTVIAPDNGGVIFDQNGTLDVETGILSLQSQFNVNGGAVFTGPGKTRVDAGTAVVNGTNTIQAGATVELAAGSWSGLNLFTGSGTFVWSGGIMAGINTVGAGANLSILGNGTKTLNVGTLVSAGQGLWAGTGPVSCTYGSIFENDGTFTVQNDSAFSNNGGGSGYYDLPAFVNHGTFRKNTTTGTTTYPLDNGGVAFNNTGTVDLQSGSLAINGNYALAGSPQLKLVLGGIDPGTQFSQETFAGAATLGGMLSVTLTNGFTPTNGQSFTLATYNSSAGQFSATQFPPLPVISKWQLTYNPGSLLLQVVPSAAFQSASLTNGNFQFVFSGQTGSSCLIQVSTNLLNWVPLFTNAPFNGTLNYVDPQTPQVPVRFYRATILP